MGLVELFDIEVEHANHYITGCGFVNKNCFDELPQFSESQYTFIIGWNRPANPRKYPEQRCRVVGAGNPPTDPEGEWVLRRWRAWMPGAERPAKAGELRWYTTIAGEEIECESGAAILFKGVAYQPRSRTFIPARLEDNPDLLKTGYAATLEAMPEPLRSIMRYGDMLAGRQDDRWQLIPTKWVVDAQRRWISRPKNGATAYGVDVGMSAGEGDKTVVAPRHGPTIDTLIKRPSKETPDGQSVVNVLIQAGVGRVPVNIDAIGIGKSAYDACVMMKVGQPRAIIVSERTDWTDPTVPSLKFSNLRAAIMWNVRHLLDPQGGPEDTRLALPPDPELLADLTAPRYKLQLSGVAVESKEDIRKRIGRSTDCGDSVALACWEHGGGLDAYLPPRPRDPSKDPITGLPASYFR